MSQPYVKLIESSATQSGVSVGASALAIMGSATQGPTVPTVVTSVAQAVAVYDSGPLVQAAGESISKGIPALCMRTSTTTAGAAGTLVVTHGPNAHTAVPVITGTPAPDDFYEIVVTLVNNVTLGTAGGKYTVSLDGGRNTSPAQALGTALTLTVHGVVFTLGTAAQTLSSGTTLAVNVEPPASTNAQLQAACDALFASPVDWKLMCVANPCTASQLGVIDAKFDANRLVGKPRRFIATTVLPDIKTIGTPQTLSAYTAAMQTVGAAFFSRNAVVCSGAAERDSFLDGNSYFSPVNYTAAAELASESQEQDISAPKRGSLKRIRVRSADGNPTDRYYDASLDGGTLDDSGFTTLRTIVGRGTAAYFNNPLLKSEEGDGFKYAQHGRVADLVEDIAFQWLLDRLSSAVRLNANGTISALDKKAIEAGIGAELNAKVMNVPMLSGFEIEVDPNAVLSIQGTELPVEIRIMPLGYLKAIVLKVKGVPSLTV